MSCKSACLVAHRMSCKRPKFEKQPFQPVCRIHNIDVRSSSRLRVCFIHPYNNSIHVWQIIASLFTRFVENKTAYFVEFLDFFRDFRGFPVVGRPRFGLCGRPASAPTGTKKKRSVTRIRPSIRPAASSSWNQRREPPRRLAASVQVR